MLFPSITFLFYFLPLFFIGYCAAPGVTAKNLFLLIASLLFYGWGEPWFVVVLVGQIVLNYGAALMIDASRGRRRSLATAIGVGLNLLLLGLFKYADFAVGTLNAVLREGDSAFALPGLALPLGISFFTFHAISYLVDVHRGQVRANRNPIEVAVYIAMFPQLVAGPIIRYRTISHQLAQRRMTFGRASAGMRIFIIGLAQKVLIADEVARIASAVFDKAEAPSFLEAWLGLGAYTIQIYFDFAGYSNMAIGLGLALGFAFPRNFRLPYTARSITEFWRRWHISLSQWLRDYLYIPLGGSRGPELETYRNLCLVFLLCGLWHGANWTFVLWGTLHGIALVICALWRRYCPRLPRLLGWALTVMFALLTGVIFRAGTLDAAVNIFQGLAVAPNLEHGRHLLPIAIITLMAFLLPASQDIIAALMRRPRPWFAGLIGFGLLAILVALGEGNVSGFAYYKF